MKLAELLKNHESNVEALEQQLKDFQKTISEEKKKLSSILAQNSDQINPEFIQWYYWETDYQIKPLADAMGISLHKLNLMIKKSRIIKYTCPCCQIETTKECTSRDEHTKIVDEINQSNSKKSLISVLCTRCSYVASRLDKRQFASQKDILNVVKYQTMPYAEYLRTEYWKKFASNAKYNAGYKCQLCNGVHNLNTHHKTYENRGMEKPEDVIVLCENCHHKFHNKLGVNSMSLREKVINKLDTQNLNHFR